METPVQQTARLLIALNELIEQEGVHLRADHFDLVGDIRQRTDPIVRQLVALAGLPGVAEFRLQVIAVVERSSHHARLLQARMEELGAEIRRTDQARHRAAQLAPIYVRSPGAAVPQFLAAG